MYAAPIVLSGRGTFAGYIKLDDDSTLLALTDRAMEHGRSLDGLQPSTYLRALQVLLTQGYPLATFMPLGVGRAIVRGDAMWLYQPCMAFMAAMLSLSLYELASTLVPSRWMRAFIAFIAAQSALLYGYALWGGIKELGTAWAVPLLVALVVPAVRSERLRALIPLAAVTALLLGVLNAGAVAWLVPALAFALVAIFRARGLQGALRAGGAFVGFTALLSLPRDRRASRLPLVQHRLVRPAREPDQAAQPAPDRRHLADRRLPVHPPPEHPKRTRWPLSLSLRPRRP